VFPRALLVIGVVAALLGGALVLRESSAERAESAPTSACGADTGTRARQLGLARTRELTLCLLNEERAGAGLAALSSEERLELAAQRYAADMVERGFFEHVDPGGLDPQDRILMAGYPSINAWTGENLAWGNGSESAPAEIVDTWMHSPGHKLNILRAEFVEIGIGVELAVPNGKPGATYVTTFGGPPTR
jgi:uncharacterized protein YkwD